MLVLDENLPESQSRLLRKWGIRNRVIGVEIAPKGTDDENLIPILHRLTRPTFFTLDRDFYQQKWVHANYCLVWLDVIDDRAAEFIRRIIRNRNFNTHAKRMGKVIRAHDSGATWWQAGTRSAQFLSWSA